MIFRLCKSALWLFLASFIAIANWSSAAERPNIVWLISEDSSIHYFEHYFAGGAPTPHIEALASHGITYRHAFSTAPVCSVARTTLITSCYAPRIGTQYHRRSVSVPMPEGLRMFPAYLRDAGYYTANNDKKDYNADESQGTWDISSRDASWRGRKTGQPFFYKQSFTTTHESSLHFPASDLDRVPTTTDASSVRVAPYHPDTPLFRYTNARYRDQIRKVDIEIGKVVDELTKDGLLEDTFIFYFGDHGGVLPRGKGYPYESGLHIPLVVRVPENFRHLVPHAAGSDAHEFVSFVDFGPTVLNLAQATYPSELVDGKPFLGPNVSREQLVGRISVLGYADRFDEKYDLVRTLRVGKYEYVRSFQPFNYDGLQNNYRYRMAAYQEWRDLNESGQLNDLQSAFFRKRPAELLFDIESDPYETKNLATDPANKELLGFMRKTMHETLVSMPDLSFYPESVLAEQAFPNPTRFGQSRREEIQRLIAIADYQLSTWPEVEPKIFDLLASNSPWERYWSIIVATSFSEAAQSAKLVETIRGLSISDEENLVRVRAAEFLALNRIENPQPIIEQAAKNSKSGIELGLIMNTMVLLKDSKLDYDIAIKKSDIPPSFLSNDVVQRRLEYLTGEVVEVPKKKNKPKKQATRL